MGSFDTSSCRETISTGCARLPSKQTASGMWSERSKDDSMAQMIPDIDEVTISNEGERAVYIALRDQLPHDWTVRYHYPYCKYSGGYLRDGEADFIVVAPERGVVFLEVKASYGYDSE